MRRDAAPRDPFPPHTTFHPTARRALTLSLFRPAAALLAGCLLQSAEAAAGKIVLSGDEWAFSDDGASHNSTYINNVLRWFELTPNGNGKKVLILDGQSWNCGFNGTCGAFGATFRTWLTNAGMGCTYLSYDSDLVPLAGYDAVFAGGRMVKASTLTNDLAAFVGAGGAVYLAGGTGTFSPATPAGDAAYWQTFLSAATGTSDFGLSGSDAWIALAPPLSFAGPVGTGVTNLDWYMGQGVAVGATASAAIWDSQRVIVATWSVPPVHIQSPTLVGTNFFFRFSTANYRRYTIEQNTNLATTNWISCTNLIGNGSPYVFPAPLSGSPQIFFRVREP